MEKITGSGWFSRFVLAGLLALLIGPHASAQAGSRGGRAPLEGLVNINAASSDQLQLLSGVGPAKAQKIVEYREKQPFRTVEELGRVKGIGPKTVRKLRAFLTVHGPTTAHRAGGAASSTTETPVKSAPPPLLQRPEPAPAPASAGAAGAPSGSLGAALPR